MSESLSQSASQRFTPSPVTMAHTRTDTCSDQYVLKCMTSMSPVTMLTNVQSARSRSTVAVEPNQSDHSRESSVRYFPSGTHAQCEGAESGADLYQHPPASKNDNSGLTVADDRTSHILIGNGVVNFISFDSFMSDEEMSAPESRRSAAKEIEMGFEEKVSAVQVLQHASCASPIAPIAHLPHQPSQDTEFVQSMKITPTVDSSGSAALTNVPTLVAATSSALSYIASHTPISSTTTDTTDTSAFPLEQSSKISISKNLSRSAEVSESNISIDCMQLRKMQEIKEPKPNTGGNSQSFQGGLEMSGKSSVEMGEKSVETSTCDLSISKTSSSNITSSVMASSVAVSDMLSASPLPSPHAFIVIQPSYVSVIDPSASASAPASPANNNSLINSDTKIPLINSDTKKPGKLTLILLLLLLLQ